jgi:hypothetical protein
VHPNRRAPATQLIRSVGRTVEEVTNVQGQGTVPSLWQLRWDVASTHVLVWLARPSETRVLRPEVHFFLADRYGRLARHHQRLGHVRRAIELDQKAEEQFRLGGGCEPPPAVAMAMPAPRPRVLVDVVARAGPWHPDDAA